MTDREKAIVMAYTGVTMLAGDKFQIFHEYIEKILGRPVWTHELADELVWNQIKEKSKDDFLDICKTEERPQGEWIPTVIDTGLFERSVCREWKCSNCGEVVNIRYPFCHCGADMRKEAEK